MLFEGSSPTIKNSKKKLIIIISSALAATLIITGILVVLLSTESTESGAELTPGYVTSIKIPTKSRKRMKSGLELSRDNQATKTSPFSKVDKKPTNTNTATDADTGRDTNTDADTNSNTTYKIQHTRYYVSDIRYHILDTTCL